MERQRSGLNGHRSGNAETRQGISYSLNTRLYPASRRRRVTSTQENVSQIAPEWCNSTSIGSISALEIPVLRPRTVLSDIYA